VCLFYNAPEPTQGHQHESQTVLTNSHWSERLCERGQTTRSTDWLCGNVDSFPDLLFLPLKLLVAGFTVAL